MAERNTRVVYRSRVVNRDEDRSRLPTASDPYDNPYAAEPLSRRRTGPRDSIPSNDDSSSVTPTARSTTRNGPPLQDDNRVRGYYGDARSSPRTNAPPFDDARTTRSVVLDRHRDDGQARRSGSGTGYRNSRDRIYNDVDIERPREGLRDFYIDDNPRQAGSPYVIEARQGDIIDISVPGRERDRDRGYGQENQRSRYDDNQLSRSGVYDDHNYGRERYTRSYDDVRGGNIVVVNSSRGRYQDNDNRQSRTPTRGMYNNRDEDWRLIDSMRDTRIEAPTNRSTYDDPIRRARTETFSSEDSYVMVSPTATVPRHREPSRQRSIIARTDYEEPDLRSRRSRSISFRDSEVQQHDASERRHERPGAEAQILGQYMRRSAPDYDGDRSDTYSAYQELGDRGKPGPDRFAATYREREEAYGPQLDHNPRKRERSRRRRRDDEADDGSYYDEKVVRKTTRESTYR